MKGKKLLEKLADYLSLDQRNQRKKREKIREVLKQLREKEHQLKARIEREQDEEKRLQLTRELDIMHAQRTKGVEMLKQLQQE
ncbi:hypothetical protein [Sedimenticola thiotaurini]|uniref:Uncharacterized protein n=1 Tax=Sedimenticola thiotaurini TaxID=1543721 RepID=A0A0F7K052_9GAMM|nr:hypothetical protein [Sedimenticola thiotaurini]AKH20293.1 hypothetical protein AAY24_07945 [Sedimenticola thiotaurini]